MKKIFPVFVALFSILLPAAVVMALPTDPPYSSWCTADINDSAQYDAGANNAYVGDEWVFGQSFADNWTLGAQSFVKVDAGHDFSGYVSADATFSQQFEVVGTGTAHIYFSYDGSLNAANNGEGTLDSMANIYFEVWAYDDSVGNYNYYDYYDEISDLSSKSYNDSFTFDYKVRSEIFLR